MIAGPQEADPFSLITGEASQLMLTLDPEPSHAKQVCRLALMLFDELEELHGGGQRERMLLECGALLHDIGWSISGKGHHKHSCRLTLEHSWEHASGPMIQQIAAIARYHRKAHPSPTHTVYGELDPGAQLWVSRLAALLRVADGLDRGHTASVRRLSAERRGSHYTINLTPNGSCSTEIWGADRKRALFEEVYDCTLSFQEVVGNP